MATLNFVCEEIAILDEKTIMIPILTVFHKGFREINEISIFGRECSNQSMLNNTQFDQGFPLRAQENCKALKISLLRASDR